MPITLQEAFDINWKHFVINKQGPAWSDKKGRCEYKAPNGCKCGIGVCFPDDILEEVLAYQLYQDKLVYQPHQNKNGNTGAGVTVRVLVRYVPSVSYFFKEIDGHILEELQRVHDGAAMRHENDTFSEEIKLRLRDFSRKYHLSILE